MVAWASDDEGEGGDGHARSGAARRASVTSGADSDATVEGEEEVYIYLCSIPIYIRVHQRRPTGMRVVGRRGGPVSRPKETQTPLSWARRYIRIYIRVCVYIYIYRERERCRDTVSERERDNYIYRHIYRHR